jgi:hypothetical protein
MLPEIDHSKATDPAVCAGSSPKRTRPKFWDWMAARHLSVESVALDLGVSRSLLYCATRAPCERNFRFASYDLRVRVWSYTAGEIGLHDWPEPPGCRVAPYVYDPALRGGQ